MTASLYPAPRHEAVLESSPDALLVVTEGGTIAMVNAAAERMFGYSRDELVGQDHRVLLPEGFRSGLQRLFFSLRRDAETAGGPPIEAYGLRRDGSEFPGEVACSLLLSDADPDSTAAVSMAVTVRDTSHRQEADACLREATSLLAATLESTADGILVVNA
ncbi:MAG TPA: PAS domain S-box protein, partial [Arthrobacter sp.]|nr:PAS domain S-box protein [Arthrobacter sp.]